MTVVVAELLARWAAGKLDVDRGDVLGVEFEHEDGWSNDSGTHWPEQNKAVVTLRPAVLRAAPHKREIEVGGMDEIPALLLEIVEAGA